MNQNPNNEKALDSTRAKEDRTIFPMSDSTTTENEDFLKAITEDASNTIRCPDLKGDFKKKPDGVYFSPRESESEDFKVCDSLSVTAYCRDRNGNNWSKFLEWQDIDGRIHKEIFSCEDINNHPNEVRGRLISGGLSNVRLKTGNFSPDYLIRYILACHPKEKLLTVEKAGWVKNHDFKNYVLSNGEVIGEGADQIFYLPHSANTEQEVEVKGTLQDWIQHVGKPVLSSSRAVLCICAYFAAPLIEILEGHRNNAGFHLVGSSVTGKSLAMKIGASVLGNPSLLMGTWHSTINGLEGSAKSRNDSVLLLDEISQSGEKKDIGNCAYKLMNGSGKKRAKVDGSLKDEAHWRLIVLSSGEERLRDIAQAYGGKANTGAELRLLDIPADSGSGLGVNEKLPEGVNSIQDYAKTMGSSIQDYHGAAMRGWLTYLTQTKQSKLKEILLREIESFVDRYASDERATAQTKQAARSFGLLAAAGEIASNGLKDAPVQLTGWQKGDAVTALGRCFKAWRDLFGDGMLAEDRRVAENVKNLLLTQRARFVEYGIDANDPSYPKQKFLGWAHIPNGKGEKDRVYYIPAVVYNQAEFNLGKPQKQVKRALTTAGILKSCDKMVNPKSADGKTIRVWELTLPEDLPCHSNLERKTSDPLGGDF